MEYTDLLLNHSILSQVNLNLATIDNFDYNIFDLNELIETQTMTFMSVEIFSRLDYFNENILNEERLINFVNKVTKGYDRNVTYHNDLHAADVLQTAYVVIRKSETLKVIIL